MTLSIVILNWKVKDLLRKCLASVYAEIAATEAVLPGFSAEVLVVDNDSRDGSVEMVAREFPNATLLANNRNLGFAAGNNPAIAMSQGDFVLLLNPDSELTPGSLAAMLQWLQAHPQAGIMGPTLLNAPDGPLQPSVMRFPTLASQVLIMLKVHNFAPGLAPLKRYFAADFDYAKAAAVEQIKGAAFLIRRSTLEQIGLLDERFFVWYEEVDFCKRAVDAGIGVWYAPVTTVVHRGGASFGQWFGPARQKMLNKSMRQYMYKHHGLAPYLVLLALHPLSMLLAYAASPLRNKRYAQNH